MIWTVLFFEVCSSKGIASHFAWRCLEPRLKSSCVQNAFQRVVADALAVLDQLRGGGLALHRAGDSKLCRLVVRAVEITPVEIEIVGAALIEPDHDDHAKR